MNLFDLSNDEILKLLSRTRLQDHQAIALVNTRFNKLINNKALWMDQRGVSSFHDFKCQVLTLPVKLRNLVISENLYLSDAKTIAKYWKMPWEVRLVDFLDAKQIDAMPQRSYLRRILMNDGILALYEELVTPEQIAKMPNIDYINNLLSDNGPQALREGLITPEQIACMPTANQARNLLSNNGLRALREEPGTPEPVNELSDQVKSRVLHENFLT